MHQDHRAPPVRAFGFGINGQKPEVFRLQPNGPADYDGVDDLVGPSFLSCQVSRQYRKCPQQQQRFHTFHGVPSALINWEESYEKLERLRGYRKQANR